ncbi:MAG TPA: DUF2306 domain-containing protein [Bradyrhizobium sp.]|nr:DUF2306 domain-containing protein [Bradyrhizobium sp.]
MIQHLTLPGGIHAALAATSIVVGLVQLLRPKGGSIHRALGYAFVYAMLIADGTVMLLSQFTGRFNILHVGAIANMLCIILAIVPVLRSPRPPNWKLQHYTWMSWAYVGLLSGGATQLVVRTSHLATREQVWTVTAAATVVVTAIGYILINRYRPVSRSHPAPNDAAIQQDGVRS